MMIISTKLGLYTNQGPNAEMQIIFLLQIFQNEDDISYYTILQFCFGTE